MSDNKEDKDLIPMTHDGKAHGLQSYVKLTKISQVNLINFKIY